MIRNSGLRRNSGRRREHNDPMNYVSNLSDVMLVLACGLMVALITFWKVDLSASVSTIDEKDLSEVDNQKEIIDSSGKTDFQEKGIVVQDPETGKMYVIEH